VLDIFVFPGRSGKFDLYEDDGLSNAYERGAFSLTPMQWNDQRREFSIGRVSGHFEGARPHRRFNIHLVGEGNTPLRHGNGMALNYGGDAIRRLLG